MNFDPDKFKDVYQTQDGKRAWEVLTTSDAISRMKAVSDIRKPAVLAVEELLLREFDEAFLNDRFKQMVGFMIKQIMLENGYQLDGQNKPVSGRGAFSKASRYKRSDEVEFAVFRDAGNARFLILTHGKNSETNLFPDPEGKSWRFWKMVRGKLACTILLGINNTDHVSKRIKQNGFYQTNMKSILKPAP
jgi:hypothetical protein